MRIAIAILSFAAGVLLYDISLGNLQASRETDAQETLAALRAQCVAPEGWTSRLLIDSLTAQPYCARFMNGSRAVSFVVPMHRVKGV